ncbi:Glycine N-acyltransferase-like protein 3 [Chionoecetes opilio]|uniref:Glycine N-acyltransferase-like protein 3 n=1 Tax=Chionoecetes opilio TaxID=41210 RepID=A0A8J4YUT2_CHIOP|nr:Glycine N-acyltransferase-like protein 3 [Chionoecetes opilio]
MATIGEVELRHVRKDELEALKQRLARHLPHSLVVYGVVSLATRYGLHSLRPASILVPTCLRPSCFTVIAPITSGTMQCLLVYWSLKEHTAKDVTDRLSRLPHLDWNQPVYIYSLATVLLPSLQSLSSWGRRRVTLQTPHIGHLYQLKAPSIRNAELPQRYQVTRLGEEDASVVWTNWKFKHFNMVESVRHDIIHFPSAGIRERGPVDGAGSLQEEAEETLVSWILTTNIGWMGNTFTVPQHRRQGLASAATMALANQLLQEGLPAFVNIEDSNTASVQLHERLGFERQSAVVVVELLPTEVANQQYLE